MLKVVIDNQFKCFPFVEKAHAEQALKRIKDVYPSAEIKELEPTILDNFIQGNNSPLFVITEDADGKNGFFDVDGFAHIKMEKKYLKQK